MEQDITPSMALTAFSMLPEHSAQVIPRISNSNVSIASSLFESSFEVVPTE
jgi:hypothetical protein